MGSCTHTCKQICMCIILHANTFMCMHLLCAKGKSVFPQNQYSLVNQKLEYNLDLIQQESKEVVDSPQRSMGETS